jgi:hypothetical protein
MTDVHAKTTKHFSIGALGHRHFDGRNLRNRYRCDVGLGVDDMTFFDLLKLDWLRTKIQHEMRVKFIKEYIRYRQRKFPHGEAMRMAEIVL